MANSPSTQLFVGLPQSGKTTFLAAMWYQARHSKVDNGLAIRSLPAERDYLTQISDTWAQGDSQLHTPQGSLLNIVLELRCRSLGTESTLCIPDLSGELYAQGWAHREWKPDFAELAAAANGILLFLHPDSVVRPTSIAEINHATASLRGCIASNPEEVTIACAEEATPFDPEKVGGEVVLIDQLQCLLGPPCNHSSLDIAVIISAWDDLEAEGIAPDEWFHSHARMLSQFFQGNMDRIATKIFGISAQGCSYDDETETRNLLQSTHDAVERVKVVADGKLSHDITLPIRWIMERDHLRRNLQS